MTLKCSQYVITSLSQEARHRQCQCQYRTLGSLGTYTVVSVWVSMCVAMQTSRHLQYAAVQRAMRVHAGLLH